MQKVYQQVAAEDDVEATSFSLTGYSLGGAHSAYVSKLDEQEKVFNFEKVLLINPSVSLYNSISILDSYLDLARNEREQPLEMSENIFSRFAEEYAQKESSAFSQDSIFSLFKNAKLSEQ